MTRVGTVNYHVHKPERQAFEIDAGGIVGKLVSPELMTTEIPLRDVRLNDAGVTFDNDSVAFETYTSAVTDFTADGWQSTYDDELMAGRAPMMTS